MGPFVWKVLGTGSAVLAGVAAKNVLSMAWQSGTGKEPPRNPEAAETSWGEAAAWAMASGALIGLARMMATRQAARFYKNSAGHLPKGLQEVQ